MSNIARQDAFRYGLLVGLKTAGLTEKAATEILFSLERNGYQTKTAAWGKALGGALSLGQKALGYGKGVGRGVMGFKAPKAMGPGLPAGETAGRVGALHGHVLRQHPKKMLAGAAAVPLITGGIGNARGNRQGAERATQEIGQQMAPMLQEYMRMKQYLMNMRLQQALQQGGGGVPPWFQVAGQY